MCNREVIIKNRTLNWGIIGAGNIAKKFANEFQYSKTDNRLIAIATRSKIPQIVKNEFNVEKAYNDYEKLFDDKEIDVIYIATTNNFHFSNAKSALLHNKHILVEKPFCLTSQEAEEIFSLAKQRNLFVMEALWSRFFPTTKNLLEIISQNIIGTIKSISADFSINRSKETKNRLFNKQLGGGATYDLGIYTIYFANLIANSTIKTITSNLNMSGEGIDLNGEYRISYKNGVVANLKSGFLENRSHKAVITGSDGVIEIENFFHLNSFILISKNNKTDVIFPFDGMGYHFEIDEVNYCITNNLTQSSLWNQNNTITTLKTIETILKKGGYEI